MAVIAISRQVAALGDEIAAAAARKLGYKFIDRKQIEEKIIYLKTIICIDLFLKIKEQDIYC